MSQGTARARRLYPGHEATHDLHGPEPIRAIDGLLSGFHDRDSSHLAMLEAIAGADLLERSYEEAAAAGYLRHEFGDLHLILP